MVVILVVLIFRLRTTFRKAKKFDKSDQIQRQLAELRKKRDEDNDKDSV
ncbi:hypothetical protein OB236_32210 [Paenibacillus sp. WQ 127069]|uniref:DUF4083 domain-containing protein n=1 Tax=Paenibacillus baimaensis TaxID=2982185 RepID=A0ABT2UQ68_9BACL|nr:hypothetical protein [Paenibacillus sp. WQ 127069]